MRSCDSTLPVNLPTNQRSRQGGGSRLAQGVKLGAAQAELAGLTEGQLEFVSTVVKQLKRPGTYTRNPESDLISDCVLQRFGDTLRIHHCFSAEPFTKDRFEYALESACTGCGTKASRAKRGNPGHDMDISGRGCPALC